MPIRLFAIISFSGLLANELVVSAFVGVLETAPAAHVIDQDVAVVRFSAARVRIRSEDRIFFMRGATFALVPIGFDDLKNMRVCVGHNRWGLILNRVALLAR